MLSAKYKPFMLSVIMLNAFMMTVVAPFAFITDNLKLRKTVLLTHLFEQIVDKRKSITAERIDIKQTEYWDRIHNSSFSS